MSRAASVLVSRPAGGRFAEALHTSSRTLILIALVLLSRVLTFEEGGLAYFYLPRAWPQVVPSLFPPAGGFWFQVLLGPWAHWDGYWYLSIAQLGYVGRPLATAFFPLYPILIRLMGGSVGSALLVSLTAFGVGMVLLYRLAAAELGPRAAWFTVLALAFFPTAFYFNAVYPESLVLALTLASLLWARSGRYGWAALTAALVSAASVDGVLLAVPLLLYLWRTHQPYRRYAWVLAVPLGLLAYMFRLWQVFGSPLMFQSVQSNWGRRLTWPWDTIWSALKNAWINLGNFISIPHLFATGQPTTVISNVWNLAFFAFGVWLIVLAFRRLDRPIWWFCVLVLAVPFLDPSAGVPFMSMPRLLLAAPPLFIALGDWLSERSRALKIYLGLSWAVGALLVALFTTAHWVA